MKNDRIALFGGSFNPPHIGHVRIAEAAAQQFRLSEVRWIPNYVSPHKGDLNIADARHRLAMTELAAAGDPVFTVSDIEIQRGGHSYSIETLRAVQSSLPECRLYFLLGDDAYATFDAWREPDNIRKLAELIVYPRIPAITQDINLKAGDHRLEGNYLSVSSSHIRTLLSKGEAVDHLLPDSVREYIFSHRLYFDS